MNLFNKISMAISKRKKIISVIQSILILLVTIMLWIVATLFGAIITEKNFRIIIIIISIFITIACAIPTLISSVDEAIQDRRINELEKRIGELEAIIKNNSKMYGNSYEEE